MLFLCQVVQTYKHDSPVHLLLPFGKHILTVDEQNSTRVWDVAGEGNEAIFYGLSDRFLHTVEPLLRGHPNERPSPLETPLNNVNLNKNVLISTPDQRPPL